MWILMESFHWDLQNRTHLGLLIGREELLTAQGSTFLYRQIIESALWSNFLPQIQGHHCFYIFNN